MTVTEESTAAVEADEDTTGEENETETEEEGGERGRKKDRDFTKFRDSHRELADYVNANSGLPAVSPNQIKAILALRSDFNNTPEQVAKREEAKAKREAEAKKYEGMTDEQIKAAKAADRVEKQVAKMEARIQEAKAKAAALREGKEASGTDLAAQVEAQQNGAETPEDSGKRRIGRNR